MRKTNKCVLVVTERSRFRDSHRFCCEDWNSNCLYFDEDVDDIGYSILGFSVCLHTDDVRNDGTIPCRCKKAQDAILKIARRDR
jgi:hypothetical protein